jgi:hypothetical protein
MARVAPIISFRLLYTLKKKIVLLRQGQLANAENELHTEEQPTHLEGT